MRIYRVHGIYWRQVLGPLWDGGPERSDLKGFGHDAKKNAARLWGSERHSMGLVWVSPPRFLELGEYSLHFFLFLLGQEGIYQDPAGVFIGDDFLSGGDLHLYLWGDGEEGTP